MAEFKKYALFEKDFTLSLLDVQYPTFIENKLARSGHTQDINEKGKRRGERERESVCVSE